VSRSRPHPWSLPDGTDVPARPVVLGVEPGEDPAVVRGAAQLALDLGTGLVCAWVDESHVVAATEADGTLDVVPVDADHDEDLDDAPPEGDLLDHLAALLTDVPWRLVYVVGDTTRGLAAVAQEYDARLVAVGTRRPGLTGWMHEVVGGSIGGRLAHTQARPVVLLPHGSHRGARTAGTGE
jgi:nucleotide-binding universal stress UspA family protein